MNNLATRATVVNTAAATPAIVFGLTPLENQSARLHKRREHGLIETLESRLGFGLDHNINSVPDTHPHSLLERPCCHEHKQQVKTHSEVSNKEIVRSMQRAIVTLDLNSLKVWHIYLFMADKSNFKGRITLEAYSVS